METKKNIDFDLIVDEKVVNNFNAELSAEKKLTKKEIEDFNEEEKKRLKVEEYFAIKYGYDETDAILEQIGYFDSVEIKNAA